MSDSPNAILYRKSRAGPLAVEFWKGDGLMLVRVPQDGEFSEVRNDIYHFFGHAEFALPDLYMNRSFAIDLYKFLTDRGYKGETQ